MDLLNSLTTDEKFALDVYIKDTFLWDTASYVLLGGKPCAIDGFVLHNLPYPIVSRKGFLVFKRLVESNSVSGRYLFLFPQPQEEAKTTYYLGMQDPFENLWKIHSRYTGDCMYFIHKKEFLETIRENLSVFQKVLATKRDANEVMQMIACSRHTFEDGLNNSEILLGILLGFGKTNSTLFQANFTPMKDRGFSLHGGLSELYLRRCAEVAFAYVAGSKETESLFKKYDAVNKKICDMYRDRDVTEVVFSMLFDN